MTPTATGSRRARFGVRTALGGTSVPSAVLLWADGQLAGGPVNGGSAVIEFVQDIREQLAEAGVGDARETPLHA